MPAMMPEILLARLMILNDYCKLCVFK